LNVFVTGTGRCGSVSFWRACQHITNYTAFHESPCGLLSYPDLHIEVNPQLRYVIEIVARRHPDAKWVHLVRDREQTAASLARLDGGNWLRSFCPFMNTVMPCGDPIERARRVYDIITAQIDASLAASVPAENRMEVHLSSIGEDWPKFWQWIGAAGDLESSLKSWETPYNTSEERGDA
jgi:hypothetical protein